MTNHWIDVKNADVVLIMGANPAENHPVSFRWILRAKDNGAKIICVDPRFTRSASKADIYAPLRPGTDIAFLGGMIRYILENKLYHEESVRNYTNASYLVNPDFRMPGDLQGLFSGYDPKKRAYDPKSWAFQKDADEKVRKDPTLKDPHCVFQLLRKHYSRYTPEMVSSITGTPKETLLKVYETYGSTGKPDKAGTELYAMGWTQHTVGTQNIRAMTIIQLLLGNMGVAGGGINALRGESNVQGSTDHGLLFHLLPGYLPVPSSDLPTLEKYIEKYTPKTKDPASANWWGNRNKYITSYLKAIYGAKATKENDFGYAWLPKTDPGQNASWLMIFDNMSRGKYKGFFAWGQNPACSGTNAGKVRKALSTLEWMVTVNLFDNETASFWKGPGVDPAKVNTEVFFLPAAASFEKEGSITNSGRMGQWRTAAVRPLGPVEARRRDHERPLLPAQGALRFGRGRLPRPAHEPRVELRVQAGGRHGPVGRHPRRGEGDQRLLPRRRGGEAEAGAAGAGGEEACREEGGTRRRVRPTAGRRHHLLRELALLPELQREGEHDGPPGERRTPRASGSSPSGRGRGR